MAKSYRSAGTGRFITKATAARHPSRTIAETRGGGATGGTYRSAATGRFVTTGNGRSHPGTTIKDS
jgi:hypothetical protein